MKDLLPFLILGVTTGSVYGMAGVGLVVTYKTSGVFNFAFGALGTTAAYLFYILNVKHGLSWPYAALISVIGLGLVLGYLSEIFARHLATKALAVRIVATIGIVLVVEGFFLVKYGSGFQVFPTYLPQKEFEIGGAFVSVSQIIVTAIALVLTIGLYVFFRSARTGVAMRAVVDDPDLVDLAGTNPRTVRRLAWIIGSMFALLSGILLAQSVDLDPVVLTALVAQAYAAAALGAFSSLPLTYVGGLAIGIAASVLTKYVPGSEYLAGLPASLPFIVLFVVLLVMPKRRLATRLQSIPLRSSSWSAPLRIYAFWGVIVIAGLAIAPQVVGGLHVDEWTVFLATIIMFLSLGLLVKTSGQISLCQAGFGAIGAVAFSQFSAGQHFPWLIALIFAGLIAVPVGAVIAIPAIRLSGLYLALATFGFGLLLENMFYNTNIMFGTTGLGVPMPRPDLSWLSSLGLNTDKGFYYVVLFFTVLISAGVVAITRTRLGRLLRAVGDSPTALSIGGTSVQTTQVLVFCISAFLAAISGAFVGMGLRQVDPTSFDPTLSLTYLALIILAVGGAPWYAIVQAAGIVLIPDYISSGNTTYYLEIVFGVFAILLAFNPPVREVPRWVVATSDAIARLLGYRPAAVDLADLDVQVPVEEVTRASGAGLAVEDLRVQFGGLVAVDGLRLAAPVGKITGLIGPNGAGKTTTFDAICGLNSPARGNITLHDKNISGASPPVRAAAGLGRTFQQMRLYDSLTVLENVRLGREAALAGRSPVSQIVGGRAQRRQINAAGLEALRLCGIETLADQPASGLSTGQRRLVELARCLAGPFDVLLLDEPSSGLDGSETALFGDLLQRVVRERGVGILLVEHDMSLVMRICDHITVLDFGKPIFEGSSAQVAASPVVRAAYLGSEGDTAVLGDVQGDGDLKAATS
jgi:ABC-type branched-subunit amino acid transport system ATPase component/branched-subunit amino acid ABC-type transport system permease component